MSKGDRRFKPLQFMNDGCPLCKKNTIRQTPMGEVCTNDDCGYVDGIDMGPRRKTKKPETELQKTLKRIKELERRICDLENRGRQF